LKERNKIIIDFAHTAGAHKTYSPTEYTDIESPADGEDEEKRTDASLASVFAASCDQASKSGLGKTSTMVAFYEGRYVMYSVLALVLVLVV